MNFTFNMKLSNNPEIDFDSPVNRPENNSGMSFSRPCSAERGGISLAPVNVLQLRLVLNIVLISSFFSRFRE